MSPVLKSMAKAFVVASVCTFAIVFVAGVVIGEERRAEQASINQWLAKDLASQFSAAGTRSLARAQKFGLLSNVEAGSFSSLASREFEVDTSVKAVWLIDAPGEDNLAPLARLERPGFDLSEEQLRELKSVLAEATQQSTSVRPLGAGLTAVAVRLGDRPRLVVVLGDESLFARASGGPTGERWLLIQRAQDGTGRVLFESESTKEKSASFPSLADIERVLIEESPSQERAEFSTTVDTSSGPFFVSGMQTGLFGVLAIAMTPMDRSVEFLQLLGRLGLGLVGTMTLLSGLVAWLLGLRKR